MKRIYYLLTITVILIFFSHGCIHGDKTPPFDYSNCNVILVSLDTVRADHLTCYGYPRMTSPILDRLAKDSVTFQTTISQAPSTEPSHASMLTSLLPSQHGAFFSLNRSVPEEVLTMAEILKQNGYVTASFNDGGQMASEFGFSQGFDEYDEDRDTFFTEKVRRTTRWIEQHRDSRFFVFLHTYKPHHPYMPRTRYMQMFEEKGRGFIPILRFPYTVQEIIERIDSGLMKTEKGDKQKLLESNIIKTKDRTIVDIRLLRKINAGEISLNEYDIHHIVSAYDAELRETDVGVYMLHQYLQDSGLYDNTLLIITSDHGEEFGEHGMMGWHSNSLYDELLHVPMIIKFPGSLYANRIVSEQVRLIDLLPTMLDFLQIPAPHFMEGYNLMHFLRGNPVNLIAYSERGMKNLGIQTSLRTEGWKLYVKDRKTTELFYINTDTREQQNLYDDIDDEQPWLTEYLRKSTYDALLNKTIYPQTELKVEKDTMDYLKALGYIN